MTLRELLSRPGITLAPGVYDALSALIATKSGAEIVYLSGASLAYTRFGISDVGLVSVSEVADTLASITDRIDTPVIVDGDNGFGNALNVQRTVRSFERAGATAIQLEDQSFPKRCGHLDGKTLISKQEMVGKIKAALDARSHQDMQIIARTDARAVEGLDLAIERAEAYRDAGADVLFIEAPQSIAEMKHLTAHFGQQIPLLANMVEGGKTPIRSADELAEIGYKIAIFPGGAVRAIAFHLQEYFQQLLAN
ncbi:MAG: isocitrate lyase/PEP mutase family protein, partial [Candidatus Puniceispirillaceae bacterium]